MSISVNQEFKSVYGPVKSWRYGRSLGIDPIGRISTCSFNCVYCQLGEIERKTKDLQVFVATGKIIAELKTFNLDDVDVITISGSGEPTLAANLGEIITKIKIITNKPVIVLTNGTLLSNLEVRQNLSLADRVAVKLDGISEGMLKRIDRPVAGIEWENIIAGIKQFRSEFRGFMGIQTMIFTPWDDNKKAAFIDLMRSIVPEEIQLNTPSRPKPLKRQLDGRGNHSSADRRSYPVINFRQVEGELVRAFAEEISSLTGINCVFRPIEANICK